MTLTKEVEKVIRSYIRAKDDNKPHLMRDVFEDSAKLIMNVKTDIMAFPSETNGVDAITRVLVTEFSKKYENIYTFCITDSAVSDGRLMLCKWVVVMTDREEGNIRIGYGDYKWTFNDRFASELAITIESMIVLGPVCVTEIYTWIQKQAYPWCSSDTLLRDAPQSVSFLGDGLNN